MKATFSLVLALTAFQAVVAKPFKRASVDDTATVGYGAGTTGGSGGTAVTVTTLEELTAAVEGDEPKVVIVDGTIEGNVVVEVGSNTSVIGNAGATLNGVGLRAIQVENVIFRNLIISKVLAEAGDAIGIQEATSVWVDHVDLSSDLDHDKDYYDGLLDITHGANAVTVTSSILHDHYKASLVGHSDSNGDEDVAITVSYALNYWHDLNSRTPSFRFGTGHIWNNVFDDNNDGINTRDEAQLLVENNVWTGTDKPIYSTDSGYVVAVGNDLGGAENTAPEGTLTSVDYDYDLLEVDSVRDAVIADAGATLTFA